MGGPVFFSGSGEGIKSLVVAKADAASESNEGCSPVQQAVRHHGSGEAIKSLMETKADTFAVDCEGYTHRQQRQLCF